MNGILSKPIVVRPAQVIAVLAIAVVGLAATLVVRDRSAREREELLTAENYRLIRKVVANEGLQRRLDQAIVGEQAINGSAADTSLQVRAERDRLRRIFELMGPIDEAELRADGELRELVRAEEHALEPTNRDRSRGESDLR